MLSKTEGDKFEPIMKFTWPDRMGLGEIRNGLHKY